MAANRRGANHGSGTLPTGIDQVAHWVRPVNATSIPQSLVFVDTESTAEARADGQGERQRFRLGVAIGVRRQNGRWVRRDVLRFADTFTFWEWVIARIDYKKPLWIFSHNLQCDSAWLDVWGRVDDGTLRLNVPCPKCGQFDKRSCAKHTPFRGAAVVSDPPIILSFRCNRGIVKIVDTMNYWKTSVAKLGKGIDLPKLDIPGDNATEAEWYNYCERDCTIVERTVCGLLDEWERDGCGHFTTTAAGLAWSAFRKTVDPKQILIDHGQLHTDLERSAYYGGQAEAFYVGKRDDLIGLLDVRSLYPSVMREKYFPVHFQYLEENPEPKKVLKQLQFDCGIAAVKVKCERDGYPVRIAGDNSRAAVEARRRLSGRSTWEPDRLAFPVGCYHTFLAGPELERAITRGEALEITRIAWYRSARIFEKFVDEWFARRPNPVTPETFARDLLCKTILNSLSGYWAKHKMRWKDRPGLLALTRWGEWRAVNASTGQVTKYRGIGGSVQELEAGGESRDSFPGISAYVTSYGREMMLWLRNRCPDRTVLYQDTDSLMVTIDGFCALEKQGLIGNGELGRLRYVDTLNGLTIHAAKDYEWYGGRVIAGIKEKAKPLDGGKFCQEAWESIAEQWSRTPDGSVNVEKVVIGMSRSRVSRPVGPDGWTIPPKMDSGEMVPF